MPPWRQWRQHLSGRCVCGPLSSRLQAAVERSKGLLLLLLQQLSQWRRQ
jgi:hypothetical protein